MSNWKLNLWLQFKTSLFSTVFLVSYESTTDIGKTQTILTASTVLLDIFTETLVNRGEIFTVVASNSCVV